MHNSTTGSAGIIAPSRLFAVVFATVAVIGAMAQVQPVQSASSVHATAVDLYQQGETAATSQDYYRAIERYLEALKQNPSYLQPMIGLADAYYSIDEYDVALGYARMAQKYAGNSTRLQNLEARILLGLGQVDAARKIYQDILTTEPYNVDARIGLAELAVAQGNTDGALSDYLDAVNLAPRNRKALLSLALLYRSRGDNATAGTYIKLALRYHAESPLVHLLAGKYYLSQGESDTALREAQTAIALQSNYPQALVLLGSIYLSTGDYAKTAATMDQVIAGYQGRPNADTLQSGSELTLAWYLKALAQARMKKPDESIQSFQRLLTIDPSDEIARIAMEQVVKESLPLESPLRDSFAAHHFNLAGELESKYLFQHALFEYRQGLQIAPFSKDGRLKFADLYRFAGYRAKYVNELEVLKNLGYTDSTIANGLEIYRSLLVNSVSADWHIKQFEIARNETSVLVYETPQDNILTHPDAGPYYASYFRDLLLGYELMASPGPAAAATSFADAFATARKAGSDYFVILGVDEGPQSIKLSASLYLARTGAKTADFTVYRSGNDRIRRAMTQLADDVHSAIPLYGTLIARKFDSGVISLGALHGVKVKDQFDIIPSGGLTRNSNGSAFVYQPDAVVGTFTVTRLDDAVAEGTLKQNGIADLMTTGDFVIPTPKEKPKQQETTVMFPPLYQQLRSLR